MHRRNRWIRRRELLGSVRHRIRFGHRIPLQTWIGVIVPTSPPAGWYADPAGSEGQRYWDGANWTKHSRAGRPARLTALATRVRRRWGAVPVLLRLVIPIVLAATLVVVGFGFWARTPRDDWAALPSRLNCQTENGSKPPGKITVSAVEVKHLRNSVLQLIIRFDEALPPSPTGTFATQVCRG